MRIWVSALIVASTLMHGAIAAEERATAKGKVFDAAGKPIDHATVIVYSAGVRKGYSLFCPTCYTDCGKRTLTDPEGNFAIAGLNPELLFNLLVVKDGYSTEYINSVDPANGPGSATLKPRPPIEDASRVLRGKVVDTQGKPLRDVLVEPHTVAYNEAGRGTVGTFGPSGWTDSAAMTNDKGEFEMAFGKPAEEMTLLVAARGMAPKLFSAPTGAERKTITVTDGALIRGRLVYNGKPVAGAEVGLVPYYGAAVTSYPEVRIGTAEDGTFAITNVPAGRVWSLYPKRESLASRGIGAGLVACETRDNGQEVNVGDIQIQPAYTLRGRVVLTDDKPIPPYMNVTLQQSDHVFDPQLLQIGPDGRFEFRGLPGGVYIVTPAVRGYRLPDACRFCGFVEMLLNRDVNDFTIRMEPQPEAVHK
jgi:uncharacterized GH25 family protein